jgi:hypothetical protein
MSINDVMFYVEVWQYRHAEIIYNLFYEVFQDVPVPILLETEENEDSDEEVLLGEWAQLMEDGWIVSGDGELWSI